MIKKLLIIILFSSTLFAQQNFSEVASQISKSFSEGKVADIEELFYFRVFLSATEIPVGYYGQSQSVKLINEFLSSLRNYSYKPISNSNEGKLGYIEGVIYFSEGTRREAKNLFFTLKKIDGKWKITQITIN